MVGKGRHMWSVCLLCSWYKTGCRLEGLWCQVSHSWTRLQAEETLQPGGPHTHKHTDCHQTGAHSDFASKRHLRHKRAKSLAQLMFNLRWCVQMSLHAGEKLVVTLTALSIYLCLKNSLNSQILNTHFRKCWIK